MRIIMPTCVGWAVSTRSTVWLQMVSYMVSGVASFSAMSFLNDLLVDRVDASICPGTTENRWWKVAQAGSRATHW